MAKLEKFWRLARCFWEDEFVNDDLAKTCSKTELQVWSTITKILGFKLKITAEVIYWGRPPVYNRISLSRPTTISLSRPFQVELHHSHHKNVLLLLHVSISCWQVKRYATSSTEPALGVLSLLIGYWAGQRQSEGDIGQRTSVDQRYDQSIWHWFRQFFEISVLPVHLNHLKVPKRTMLTIFATIFDQSPKLSKKIES